MAAPLSVNCGSTSIRQRRRHAGIDRALLAGGQWPPRQLYPRGDPDPRRRGRRGGAITPDTTFRVERFSLADKGKLRPYRITTKLVQELIDQMAGLLDHAPLKPRVACVGDLFEGIDVDGRATRRGAVEAADRSRR